MILTKDIENKILKDFSSNSEHHSVRHLLEKIALTEWNVGSQQLCRAILYLLDGDVSKLKKFELISDPRDVITEAENKAGNPGHYFEKPFT
ncbi:hypothetical protein [Roseivirga misakiensis]|uniref:Uncharacterized protein n=1 Tax=Roseivirga misakiensis TaxID=1563681 RepID=A0A1E5T215_9BACT|nr:hypothetical protein [Roseivirga misakiensis]OEK05418.1 hypothetical protein BFP71_18695 [Roseivirga misakiensis]